MSSQVLEAFAGERRRIASSWRILLVARRLARAKGEPLPSYEKAIAVLGQMLRGGAISRIEEVHDVYRIDVPFAQVLSVSDEQIIQEAHPWVVFSGLTALAYHGLTDVIAKRVYATDYGVGQGRRIPLGTSPEDWIEVDLPSARRVGRVGGAEVIWRRTKADWDFGHTVGYSQGLGIYVTDLERTLIDGLRTPEFSGGISVALLAWREARERINVDNLVGHVEKFESGILNQRVGYLLDLLRLTNPRRETWRTTLLRGGSMKLVADAPYDPVYSEQWNLSLNVPELLLKQLKE